ncbi:MAG: helix-turn-helix transcriptional regulator [Opitutae bacterium]|nr:helix-turn-helix transcriptional regulator [Opitutae bacterium]
MSAASSSKTVYKIATPLRAARARRPELSQRKIAEMVAKAGVAGFTSARLSRIELGYADATWPEVVAIAQSLEVQPDWLVGRIVRAVEPALELPKPVVPTPVAPPPAPVAKPKPAAPPAPVVPPVEEPPAQLPDRGTQGDITYRGQLAAELARVNARLQERMPAAVWQKWRVYQKTVQQALQNLSA